MGEAEAGRKRCTYKSDLELTGQTDAEAQAETKYRRSRSVGTGAPTRWSSTTAATGNSVGAAAYRRRRYLWLTAALTVWFAFRYPIEVEAPAANIAPPPLQRHDVALATLQSSWPADEPWYRVRYQIGRAGKINALQARVLVKASELFGAPAQLTGSDYGGSGEYRDSPAHRLGCAIDTMLPRLPRADIERRTRELAAWMVAEVDYRTRVVVYLNHPRKPQPEFTDHVHVAVRCHNVYGPAERAEHGSHSAWLATIFATTWSWNGD